jgi:hypothetical protein
LWSSGKGSGEHTVTSCCFTHPASGQASECQMQKAAAMGEHDYPTAPKSRARFPAGNSR